MPAEDGLGLNDDQDAPPAVPPPAQCDPEHPVDRGEPRSRSLVLEDCQLLAQGQDLERQIRLGAKDDREGVEKRSKHAAIMA